MLCPPAAEAELPCDPAEPDEALPALLDPAPLDPAPLEPAPVDPLEPAPDDGELLWLPLALESSMPVISTWWFTCDASCDSLPSRR
jgi:hypothetical protein